MNIKDEDSRFQIMVKPADTFIKRLKGLMLKPSLPCGQGLLLTPCSGIHTCFMRFPIDAVYVSGQYKVLDIETIAPWRVGKRVAGTRMILETAAGDAALLQIGSNLIVENAPAAFTGPAGPVR